MDKQTLRLIKQAGLDIATYAQTILTLKDQNPSLIDNRLHRIRKRAQLVLALLDDKE